MNKPVFEQVLEFLKQVPQTISPDTCELCGGEWLVTISNIDRYGLPVRFEMCRQCGLVTQNPRWDSRAYSRFYTEFYRPLVTEWHGYPSMATSRDGALERYKEMVCTTALDPYLPKSPRILDIGGGNGVLAEFMRDEFGGEVTVVEPNGAEAEEAARKGFDVVCDVFENATFDPATFDLILMIRTVDHLIHASGTFTKIRQALKPGGYLLVDSVDYFRRMAYLRDPVAPLKIDHCYYFSPESLTMLMRKNGLHPVVSDTTVLPGQIVNLVRVGEPDAISIEGVQTLPEAAYRYFEWEQLANRPNFMTKPGYLVRTVYSDLGWLTSKLRSKVRRR